MKSVSEFSSIYIHRAPVDMRKSINGLSIIVDQEMQLDLRQNSLFIFCNRRRTHIKILYFDKSGFALWFKRLEEAKFPWPKDIEQHTIKLSVNELNQMLEGINIWTRFKKVHFEHII